MLNKQFHNGNYIVRYSLVDGELSVVYIAQVVEYECMMEGKLLFVHSYIQQRVFVLVCLEFQYLC